MESQGIHRGLGAKFPSDRNHNALSLERTHIRLVHQAAPWENSSEAVVRWQVRFHRSERDSWGLEYVGWEKIVIISYILESLTVTKPFSMFEIISSWLHRCEEVSVIILILEMKKISPSRYKKQDCQMSKLGKNWNLNPNFFCTTSDAFLRFRTQSSCAHQKPAGPLAEDPRLPELNERLLSSTAVCH